MSFLRPEFLWALPLAALPVLIHLLNRRRFVRVDFSAMEFLRRARHRTRRRLLLEDLLLLVLRTAAVLAVVLGLARPSTEPVPGLASRLPAAEILVLDGSLSMAHRDGGTSAFERALQAGAEVLRELESARGDRAALILASGKAARLAFGEPLEVRAALAEQDRPEPGRADWPGALGLAARTAEAFSREGAEVVRVTLLTDLQATGFDLAGPEGAALRDLASRGFRLGLWDTGAVRRENTAVIGLETDPPELAPGNYGEVHAFLRHFGGAPRSEVRATLLLDGAPVATADLAFAPGEQKEWTVPVAPAATGPRAVEVRLEPDALQEDDRRACVLPVRAAPRVLLLGESAPPGATEDVFTSLRRFLDLGAGAPVTLQVAAPGRLQASALADTDVVLLADPGVMSPSALAALAEFHLGGGGVLLAAGPATGPAEAGPILAALGVEGLEWGDVVEAREPSARLAIQDPSHPALQLFRDPRWQPLLTEVPFPRYRPLRVRAPAGPRVLLRFVRDAGEGGAGSATDAALVEWRGGGHAGAALAAVPLPAWNRLAEVPAGALPLLLDLLWALAPRPEHPLAVEVGQAVEIELPRPPAEVLVTDPTGSVAHAPAQPQLLPGGRARQIVTESAGASGIWTARAHLYERDGTDRLVVESVAAVTPPEESDLAPLDPERLRAVLPPDTELRAPGQPTAAEEASSQGPPRDFSRALYLLAVFTLAAETALAAVLDRRRG